MNKNTTLNLTLFTLLLITSAWQIHNWFDGNNDLLVKVGLFQALLIVIGFIASLCKLIEDKNKKD